MRGGRDRGEGLLERALEALRRGLNDTGAPWMIVGGIAIIARGVRRLTTDIDAVVRGDAVGVDTLLEVLARRRIVPRIPDARRFARTNLVLLLRHAPTGVDLDVSLGWSSFEVEALATSDSARYGRVTVPMARAEDLVVFKIVAARPKDLEDAAALLALYPNLDLTRVRRRIRELAALAEAPELLEGLESAVKTSRRSDRPRSRPRRRRRSP